MTDLLTALAGLALVAVFPIAIIAVYRWQARREAEFRRQDEEIARLQSRVHEARDNIERRARKGM
jgi:hypothetical protein